MGVLIHLLFIFFYLIIFDVSISCTAPSRAAACTLTHDVLCISTWLQLASQDYHKAEQPITNFLTRSSHTAVGVLFCLLLIVFYLTFLDVSISNMVIQQDS